MSNYTWEYIEKHKQETKRLLGMNHEQLEQLIEYSLMTMEKQQKEKDKNQKTLIKAGGGRKSKLSAKNQILLTLTYLRHHLSFQILGLIFEISESTAHTIFHHWQKIIRDYLSSSLIDQGESGENLNKKVLLIDRE